MVPVTLMMITISGPSKINFETRKNSSFYIVYIKSALISTITPIDTRLELQVALAQKSKTDFHNFHSVYFQPDSFESPTAAIAHREW